MVDGVICSTWGWSRAPGSIAEVEELRQLLVLCHSVVLNPGEDILTWSVDVDEAFSFKSLKNSLAAAGGSALDYSFAWNNWVPRKVNVVAWRAELERLPTFVSLAARNLAVTSNFCPFCGEVEETAEHLFVSCRLAQDFGKSSLNGASFRCSLRSGSGI
ncbi:uncharacterized protein LOC143596613 [Bidens hawaiensis]|uniref:uncharacterized protein LOC143596613 n=1 Tax=Bidens hawaiensis TaxID=980011 RepID=UPI004049B51D